MTLCGLTTDRLDRLVEQRHPRLQRSRHWLVGRDHDLLAVVVEPDFAVVTVVQRVGHLAMVDLDT